MINSLNIAQTGLSASKTAVENVSNNIANENTPGYKKRVVQLNELGIIDGSLSGAGVEANEVYRITSQYLYDNIMTENTKTNYYKELSSVVGNIEQMFKESAEAGFSNDLDRYFQAIENLRSAPDSEIYASTLKSQGSILVESIKSLYSKLEQQEEVTFNTLEDNVNEINSILNDISQINKEIEQTTIVNNDLLDKRDLLEKKLSTYVDIEVKRDNGYELRIAGDIALTQHSSIREVNLVEEPETQIDRFAISDNNNRVYDSLKYTLNDNGTVNSRTYQNGDIVTYKLDNTHEVSVTIGDYVVDANGNNVDLDGDNVADVITSSNLTRALVYEINQNSHLSHKINAFNGNYTIDDNGVKNDSISSDKFLVVEAIDSGTDNSFIGRIVVTQANTPSAGETTRDIILKNDYQSQEAEDNVYIAFYEQKLDISSGQTKAQLENLNSENPNNKIAEYKQMLDNFANSLSDITDAYIKTDTDTYLHGDLLTDSYDGNESIKQLNLFSGIDVKSLVFNENAVNELEQNDLEYLSSIQWKNDINFDGTAQDGSSSTATSFSDYFQELRVSISSDKENSDLFLETQEAVLQSLEYSYDELTKVDSDEEMVDLIKFQAAYTANAKIITVVDEMLQTLLNIR